MSIKLQETLKFTEKKSRIVVTAKNLFFEQGFASTSINMIQKKAKISKGLIYYHFKNKDDLGIAVLQHVLDQEFMEFDQLIHSISNENDKSRVMSFLDNYLDRLFASTMQDRRTIQIIIDLLLNLKSTTSKQKVRKLYLGYIDKIAKFLEFLGVEQPTIHAKLVISILDGLMYVNMALGETLTQPESEQIIRALKCMIQLEERL
ncbi:MAG: TetR/AcrR family transcriptional regulator [Candidatus Kariarchaeaceae archaeon]